MKIYNTLTRTKEEFVPIEPGKVKLYACGPTVYNFIHIGNARPICVFDTLRRYLEYRGYEVRFVQNFTDIDDKLINKANEEGMVRHFETIADAAGVPVVMYNVPGRTACSLSVKAVERLSRHPNIAGIKEASGNLAYVAKIARYASEDFCILSGEDAVIVPVMSLGGTGVISVLANVCPARTHEMVAAFAAGDVAHARALQLKYTDLIEKLFMEVNPIPVKEAMNLLGMDVGGYRLPLCGMEKAHREVLAEALRVIA